MDVAIREIEDSLKAINKAYLVELKSFAKPHPLVI
jgi:hypothetical protein